MYVTDTHPLIWYASRTHRQLSHRALRAFEQAENGEAFILVPAPVLWEVSILDKAGHITLSKPFDHQNGVYVVALDVVEVVPVLSRLDVEVFLTS